MASAGLLMLLSAAVLVLIPSGNCDKMCSPVIKDVNLFLMGSPDEYINNLKNYNLNPIMLSLSRKLKECVDGKLTEEDKQLAQSALHPNIPAGSSSTVEASPEVLHDFTSVPEAHPEDPQAPTKLH
ncbi:major allergen I polypeptide chain 1-like [Tupaia chinensis]|uniref:major allergen I polypeptide chain 1-like n=1 Tax=Tupaia chinensis TaxID=246437 RepID=UPI0003C9060C|nr:major allergen I polypeptide chain 1-like [Tupaia chinensis]